MILASTHMTVIIETTNRAKDRFTCCSVEAREVSTVSMSYREALFRTRFPSKTEYTAIPC